MERVLGRGGMGTVYGAINESIGRAVAIKMLQPALTREWTHVERFHREAELSASLGHPNIVSVTDFHHADKGLTFYVMELLEGEHLYRLMKREGRLPPERASGILIQVLSALGAAHDAGVVHRDLKPPNVFIVPLAGASELVKLLDFGIAKLRECDGYQRLTATGAIVGTPHFIAPEQARGRPVDGRTDLFAAGVLLHYMLAGKLPFDKPEMGDLIIQICSEEPQSLDTLLPNCDPALARVTLKAMAKDPAARFQTAAEMAAALAPFAAAEPSWPTGPMPAAPSQQPTRPARARRPSGPSRPSTPDQSSRMRAAVASAPTWAKVAAAVAAAALGLVLIVLGAGVTWYVMDDAAAEAVPPGAQPAVPAGMQPVPPGAPPALIPSTSPVADAGIEPEPAIAAPPEDTPPASRRRSRRSRRGRRLGRRDPVPVGVVQQADGERDPNGPPIGLVQGADGDGPREVLDIWGDRPPAPAAPAPAPAPAPPPEEVQVFDPW